MVLEKMSGAISDLIILLPIEKASKELNDPPDCIQLLEIALSQEFIFIVSIQR